jgi:hypothetical protein
MVGIERLTNRDETSLEQVFPDTGTPGSFFSQRMMRRVNSLGLYGMEQIGIRNRLFVTAALRHDGFDDYRLWSATHPSLAVDWIARREQPGALGRLALRVAYGRADQPPPALAETFVILPFPSPFPQLKPERTREYELSGEASGLGGKWRAQVSLYDARSEAIQSVSISGPSGYATGFAPGAVLSNRGIAAAVSANLVDRAVWGWDVQLSFWGNRNRLVKQVSPPSLYGDAFAPAQGEFTGYPANGYWGRPVTSFSDLNGDGILGATEVVTAAGFTWMGTPYPTQGVAVNSSWRVMRRWRLSATLDYRAGQTLFNQTANMRCQYALCRGRIDRTASLAEQATALTAYDLPLAYYEDADYLKLRELAVTFDVPERVTAALGARAATVMIGGRDLLTWTRYSGPDPETGSYGRHHNGSPTIVGDFATVPMPASWTVRVRVSY